MPDVISFPSRLGNQRTSVQLAELRKLTSGNVLAAIAIKHPDISLSADELMSAATLRGEVRALGPNEWGITATPKSDDTLTNEGDTDVQH